MLQDHVGKNAITIGQVQSLSGELNFFTKLFFQCRVIVFVRRMHDITYGILPPHHFIKIKQQMKKAMSQIFSRF